jgi:hypothetical protein
MRTLVKFFRRMTRLETRKAARKRAYRSETMAFKMSLVEKTPRKREVRDDKRRRARR